MSFNYELFGPFGLVIGIGALGFSVYQNNKAKNKLQETTSKLDIAIDDITKDTPIEIQQAMIDKAIERAVDREVKLAVAETARRVREDIRAEIRNEIKKEVEDQYNSIASEVSDKISDQVAAIDEYALKDRVTKKAEEKVMKKLDGILDGALGMFNNQLGNVNKIYQNIADTIAGRANNGYNPTNRLN